MDNNSKTCEVFIGDNGMVKQILPGNACVPYTNFTKTNQEVHKKKYHCTRRADHTTFFLWNYTAWYIMPALLSIQ